MHDRDRYAAARRKKREVAKLVRRRKTPASAGAMDGRLVYR
jgi:hypothetical protein